MVKPKLKKIDLTKLSEAQPIVADNIIFTKCVAKCKRQSQGLLSHNTQQKKRTPHADFVRL